MKQEMASRALAWGWMFTIFFCWGGWHPAWVPPLGPVTAEAAWLLEWSDEFEGNGTEVDEGVWSYQLGDGCDYGICGWGNGEYQVYTDHNAWVDNDTGVLVIRVDHSLDATSGATLYHSARLRTAGRRQVLPNSRIEARIQLPKGQGLWPAFWLLPTNTSTYGTWAGSGEIDVMEAANMLAFVKSTLHFGGSWPHQTNSDVYPDASNNCSLQVPPRMDLSSSFHIYAAEWLPDRFRFFFDDFMLCEKTACGRQLPRLCCQQLGIAAGDEGGLRESIYWLTQ
eukprot:jgi/Mesvir1/1593/Mv14561-RA.1